MLVLKRLEKIQVPASYKNAPQQPPKYEYALQTSLSLFSAKRGFIGRTYTGSEVALGSKPSE